MIDGKAFSAISESSTQRCGICGAYPKNMNDLSKLANLTPNIDMYKYGLSTLHAWIRCLEYLLHISYKLDIKKWKICGNEHEVFDKRKNKIINELKEKMHILVDIPKSVSGTTNDGNTARQFFSKPCLASTITGIDERVIKNLGTILRTMACGYAILLINLYFWYYMPSSVHKILIHGAEIIKCAALPIGMFSEEAMEARNKDIRNYREFNTRKMSREQTMEDLFNRLMFSSDPLISSISRNTSIYHRDSEPLPNDVRKLLSDPMFTDCGVIDDTELEVD